MKSLTKRALGVALTSASLLAFVATTAAGVKWM